MLMRSQRWSAAASKLATDMLGCGQAPDWMSCYWGIDDSINWTGAMMSGFDNINDKESPGPITWSLARHRMLMDAAELLSRDAGTSVLGCCWRRREGEGQELAHGHDLGKEVASADLRVPVGAGWEVRQLAWVEDTHEGCVAMQLCIDRYICQTGSVALDHGLAGRNLQQ